MGFKILSGFTKMVIRFQADPELAKKQLQASKEFLRAKQKAAEETIEEKEAVDVGVT